MPGDAKASAAARTTDVAAQLTAAFVARHPLDDMHSGLPQDLQAIARWLCHGSRRESVPIERNARMSKVTTASRALQGASQRLSSLSPRWIRDSAPLPHYALIDCLIVAIGWPDTSLTTDPVCGAPCVGDIPNSGLFRPAHQPASIFFRDVNHEEWNRRVVQQLLQSAGTPQRKADAISLWERTQKEVSAGFASPIGSMAQVINRFGVGAWRCSTRFGVVQKTNCVHVTIARRLCTIRPPRCTR
jgi:hypothetical protein